MNRFTLALLSTSLLAGTADADIIYNYSFGGNATGQFTTGAAAADAGYFLVTALDVQTFIDANSGPQSVSNAHVIQFTSGAAFNPTTGAFINHSGGNTFQDIGQIIFTGTFGGVSLTGGFGNSFRLGSTQLFILGNNNGQLAQFAANGPLTIQQAAVPTPEPATLTVFGLLGLGGLLARRRSAA